MRINRQKKVSRILKFYSNNFGFSKPYQVLVDGTFCNTALQNKINIAEQLQKYLGDVRLLTTPCVILEMEKLGSALYGATLILKQFPVHHCGHKTPLFAATCIKKMIEKNSDFRYILASQDRDLQRFVTSLPGIPLLYIFNKAPTLRPPNELSVKKANQHLYQSCDVSAAEKKVIKLMKRKILEPNPTSQIIKRSRKKKGGPNPLSCKKKKPKPTNNNSKGQINKKTPDL
ncbi:unnamed protein product [Nezara viridula]|uniref:rRNA-processing protein UTP23 homolog n=1 Tax=Nezara viridula TaxID=85310 RepID=A0A9P0E7V3_NEZVI|nr:unnamed protein product [Nezara viridula]